MSGMCVVITIWTENRKTEKLLGYLKLSLVTFSLAESLLSIIYLSLLCFSKPSLPPTNPLSPWISIFLANSNSYTIWFVKSTIPIIWSFQAARATHGGDQAQCIWNLNQFKISISYRYFAMFNVLMLCYAFFLLLFAKDICEILLNP